MKQDQAIVYKALYEEVKMAIKNIDTLGFDTTLFVQELKSINEEVTNNVKTKLIQNMAEASLIAFYSNGIKRLETLKNRLDYFDIYFKAYYTCENISLKLSDKTSKEDLEKIVSRMCYILREINKSSTIDYDSESKIVEKMYEVAYNIIKYEIIANRKSTLFEFIKNTDINNQFFNGLILKDIERIDLRKDEYKQIKVKLTSLMENGIYSNYFDYELIKLIVLYDNNIDLKKLIIDDVNRISNEIINSNSELKKDFNHLITLDRQINSCNYSIKKERKDLAIRLPIIGIILTGYILGGVGVQKLSKKVSTEEAYNSTKITYSSLTDDYQEKKDEQVLGIDSTHKKIAITYSEPNRDNERRYYEYDLSNANINFETLKEYYEYGIENLDIKPYSKGYVKTNDNKNGYVEIIDITYEDLGYTSVYKPFYIISMICFYALYVSILALLTLGFSCSEFICDDTIYAFQQLRTNKKGKKIKILELKEIVDTIINEINKNEELRIEFNKLYEENKYLLNNPEELMNKIDEIDFEEVKKLVKKYN